MAKRKANQNDDILLNELEELNCEVMVLRDLVFRGRLFIDRFDEFTKEEVEMFLEELRPVQEYHKAAKKRKK